MTLTSPLIDKTPMPINTLFINSTCLWNMNWIKRGSVKNKYFDSRSKIIIGKRQLDDWTELLMRMKWDIRSEWLKLDKAKTHTVWEDLEICTRSITHNEVQILSLIIRKSSEYKIPMRKRQNAHPTASILTDRFQHPRNIIDQNQLQKTQRIQLKNIDK